MPIAHRLTHAWNLLPASSRSLLRRTGVPYVWSYLASYRARFGPRRFCGTLPALLQEYRRGDAARRDELARAFDAVLDSLVLPNGVRKTSYPRRHDHALRAFLSRPDRPADGTALRVLDLPCSSGAASLDAYHLLRRTYRIQSFVLADLCMEVGLDPDTGCVYDPAGNLLQVRTRGGFFSLHRPHSRGDAFSPLAAAALLPFAARAAYLRRRHPRPRGRSLTPVRLLHPSLEPALEQGVFAVRSLDVFDLRLSGEFDLVTSFNLLQKNYFPPGEIARGLEGLTRALAEGGFLLWGNTESFGIARKRGGRLEELERHGDW